MTGTSTPKFSLAQSRDRSRRAVRRGVNGIVFFLLAALASTNEVAILSAVSGSWSVEGHTLTLSHVLQGAPGHELRLRLE